MVEEYKGGTDKADLMLGRGECASLSRSTC